MSAPSQMRCEQARSHLPLFVGGDLDGALSDRVCTHLRGCHECRRDAGIQLQALRSLQAAAGASMVPGVDEAMFLELYDCVLAQVARSSPPVARGRAMLRRAGIAAAACVLFGLGWMVSRPAVGLLERTPIQAPGGVTLPIGNGAHALQQLGQDQWWPRAVPAGWTVGRGDPGWVDPDRFDPGWVDPGDARPGRAESGRAGSGGGLGPSGLGLMGRLSLRTLEDEQVLVLTPDAAAHWVSPPADPATGSPGALHR